jgi:pimeloyl-ACP methyl ester carboxylesterase
MIETSLRMPLPDGQAAYGKLRPGDKPELVIFAHGLASGPGRTLPTAFAHYFADQGYPVLRFGFYDERPDARKLEGCTLAIHIADLQAVFTYAQAKLDYDRIHLIGHSFGGLTIVGAHLPAASAVLLDPSHPSYNPFREARYIEPLDRYTFRGNGMQYLIGPAMVKEAGQLTAEDVIPGHQSPTLVVSAMGSVLAKTCVKYAEDIPGAKLVQVDGADHSFSVDEHLDQALLESHRWIGAHSAS